MLSSVGAEAFAQPRYSMAANDDDDRSSSVMMLCLHCVDTSMSMKCQRDRISGAAYYV